LRGVRTRSTQGSGIIRTADRCRLCCAFADLRQAANRGRVSSSAIFRLAVADQAPACERRNHSSKPMRPRRTSPNGTSERSSTRPPQYRAGASAARGNPVTSDRDGLPTGWKVWAALTRSAGLFSPSGPSGMVAVLAMQVREQEYQWKRQRPDKRSNPGPGSEAASSMLSNSTGKIDRTDQRGNKIAVHDARSNAALR
jgi:hypothetical protein